MDNWKSGCAFGIGVFFLFYIVSEILDFISTHWPWFVAAALLAVVIIIILIVIAQKLEAIDAPLRAKAEVEKCNQQAAAESLAAQAKVEERNKLAEFANQYINDFSRYLTSCLVIDSNIWMNEEYDDFFVVMELSCRKYGYKLILFCPQFDEISNIKKKVGYGESKNSRARLAINRIEHFQISGLLNVRPITIDSQKGAYADPIIVKIINLRAKAGDRCCFISDDKELRVRVRQHLLDNSENKTWEIVGIDSILSDCKRVTEARKEGLIEKERPRMLGYGLLPTARARQGRGRRRHYRSSS